MSFICGRCKDAMCDDCRSIAEEYEELLNNWKRATSIAESMSKELAQDLETEKRRTSATVEMLREERERTWKVIYSAFNTMRGGGAYKEIVLHTLDTIKPYVVGKQVGNDELPTQKF